MDRMFFHKGRIYTRNVGCDEEMKISFCVDDSAYISSCYDGSEGLMISTSSECNPPEYLCLGDKYIGFNFFSVPMEQIINDSELVEIYSDINCNGLHGTVVLHRTYRCQIIDFLLPAGNSCCFDLGIYCAVSENAADFSEIKDFCKTDLVKKIFETIRVEKAL